MFTSVGEEIESHLRGVGELTIEIESLVQLQADDANVKIVRARMNMEATRHAERKVERERARQNKMERREKQSKMVTTRHNDVNRKG